MCVGRRFISRRAWLRIEASRSGGVATAFESNIDRPTTGPRAATGGGLTIEGDGRPHRRVPPLWPGPRRAGRQGGTTPVRSVALESKPDRGHQPVDPPNPRDTP